MIMGVTTDYIGTAVRFKDDERVVDGTLISLKRNAFDKLVAEIETVDGQMVNKTASLCWVVR